MKIWQYLTPDRILLDVCVPGKDALLRLVSDSFKHTGAVRDSESVYMGLKRREDSMSTGIGGGIAVPHTMSPDVDALFLLLMHLKKPIPYQAIDGKPVDIVAALLVPENEAILHLNALAGISGLCRKPGFLDSLRRASDPTGLYEAIRTIEEE